VVQHITSDDLLHCLIEGYLPRCKYCIQAAQVKCLELTQWLTPAQVLEDLVEENDSVPEVWHLLCLAYYGAQQLQDAKAVLEQARSLITKLAAGSGEYEDVSTGLDSLEKAIQAAEAETDVAPDT
jgi:hypothetical protein